MTRALARWAAVIVFGVASLQAAKSQQSVTHDPASPSSPHRAVLIQYCATCHNGRLKTADLDLDNVDLDNVAVNAEVWEKVVRKLRTRVMPPSGMPRPDPATYDALSGYLETALDRAAASMPNPGRTVVHRLNRAEYANAVRDLLAVDIANQPLLPNEDSGEGFDNIAQVLSVSPALLERYLGAARKISHLAIGDVDGPPRLQTYAISDLLTQEDRMSEDLPLGSRGGIAVRHHFSADGEYVLKVRFRRSTGDFAAYVRGLAESHQLDVRLDGVRLKLLTVGGEHRGRSSSPTSFGDAEQEEYEIHVDEGLDVRFLAKAGTRLIQVTFPEETWEPEGVFEPGVTAREDAEGDTFYLDGQPALQSVIVGGPYDPKGPGETPSRSRIFVCRPRGARDEDSCASTILSTLARRAYRRPVTETDVTPLLRLYRATRTRAGFEEGIRVALQRILVSPNFLFRVESDPANAAAGKPYRISGVELASRLSFFLWSSLPDDELLDLAARGKLRERAVLEQQVRRMLADSRSKALVSNFAGQWLRLRELGDLSRDPEEFPDFDDNLRDALRQETELLFGNMLRENHRIRDLLDADYTFLNERLARHYGIPNVYGSRFRRVTLSDENRRGLLGQGSLLTVTSYANRTSAVLRGKWILDNILGTPPPPPPPNVPSLKDRSESGKILSVRQQLELHRSNAVCAGCHSRMDPLGFALENFDAVGKWRTTEGSSKTAIDPSGVLPDGTKIHGAADLRNVLTSRSDQFVTTVTEKLLTYALGRRVEYYDAPVVRNILRDTGPDHRWASVILGIVNSTPFQMRRSRSS